MNIKLSKSKIIVVIIITMVLGTAGTYLVLFGKGAAQKLTPGFVDKSFVSSSPGVYTAASGVSTETSPRLSDSSATQMAGQPAISDLSSQFGLKIIKNGNLDLLVEKGKFTEVFNKIASVTNSFSGNVTNSNYTKDNENYYGTVTVIIPTKDFDQFVQSISALGKVLTFNVNSADVTGEYVDLNSKLKVLNEQNDLLLSWLKDAKSLQDMITLRNEIQNVQTEIETTKGRLNYISFHTDFSSISVNLSEVNKTPLQPSEWLSLLMPSETLFIIL
ncbi:MAG: DUF4349 domain-containing protein [Caldisericaceae bacterium]